jgi:hypothetical protein
VKEKFLVCYDYGTCGLWAVILARSKDEITEMYPAVKVIEQPPFSMTPAELAEIESKSTFDIDDEPSGWLKVLKDDPRLA